jgi:hypothetical protein
VKVNTRKAIIPQNPIGVRHHIGLQLQDSVKEAAYCSKVFEKGGHGPG